MVNRLERISADTEEVIDEGSRVAFYYGHRVLFQFSSHGDDRTESG